MKADKSGVLLKTIPSFIKHQMADHSMGDCGHSSCMVLPFWGKPQTGKNTNGGVTKHNPFSKPPTLSALQTVIAMSTAP